MSVSAFTTEAPEAFAFLERDFGFALEVDGTHWAGPRLRYVNATTFVVVELDPRQQRFGVALGPLVDGEIPPSPAVPGEQGPIRWYPLWAIAGARGEATPPFSFSARPARLRAELDLWASVLRDLAGPALAGDFKMLWAAAGLLRVHAEFAS